MRARQFILVEYDRSKTESSYGKKILSTALKDNTIPREAYQIKNGDENAIVDMVMSRLEDSDPTAHKEYVQALLDRNITEFNKITQNICETQLVIGFMNYSHYAQLNNDINLKYIEALHFADKLISLAEYLKISKVYNGKKSSNSK